MITSCQQEPVHNILHRIPNGSHMAIEFMACPSKEIYVGIGADDGRLESAPTFITGSKKGCNLPEDHINLLSNKN
jgi:hypothetical protein